MHSEKSRMTKTDWGSTRGTLLLLFALLLTLFSSCFEILEVRQPSTVQVGEVFSIEIDAKLTGEDGNTLIFGFLAPRSWRPDANTEVSFTSTIGNSTMSLIDPEEVEIDNKQPWEEALNERVGFGSNYGEVRWTIFKADNDLDPSGTSEDNPVTGTITITTQAGGSNLITQLGYFIGESVWGFLDDGSNSTFTFVEECIEVSGAAGQAQNLCGPAPRQLISLPSYNFNDVLTITFDAREDSTALIGANEVFACYIAINGGGSTEICEHSTKTSMEMVGPDLWQMTIWPPSYFGLDGNDISEILVNFRDATGSIVVKDVGGNDFQILAKCF